MQLSIEGVEFHSCYALLRGGAIMNNGVATITGSSFFGGIANSSAAIYNNNLGTLTVSSSRFANGNATDGGAVGNAGSASFTGAIFSSNLAAQNGGDFVSERSSATTTFEGCTFSKSRAMSGNGGSMLVSGGGSVSVSSSSFSETKALVYGGGIFVDAASLTLAGATFTDSTCLNGDIQSRGGALYVRGVGSGSLVGTNVVINTTDANVWTGPALPFTTEHGVGQGGGVAFEEGTTGDLDGLVCDGLASAQGPCMYTFSATVAIANARVVNNYGFFTEQAAAFFIADGSLVTITNSYFASNRLNPSSETHQGAAVYSLASEVRCTGCEFFNHSAYGNGGTIFVESGSTLVLTDCTARKSYASGLGGFLFASSSSATLTNVTVRDCSAVLTASGKGTGQGGAVYATLMFAFFITDSHFYDNVAVSGGALYLNQIKEAAEKDNRPLYFGARVFGSVFERNNATSAGGAVTAKQTILWAKRSRFTDNVCEAGRGSALDLGLDAIYQLCTFETSREASHNGTMLEAFRTLLDSCTLRANQGIGVRLNQDQGTLDTAGRIFGKTYPLLSRNTDLSGVRVSSLFANDRWDWMKCKDRFGNREIWRYEYENIPSFLDAGVYFSPACPLTASCEDDYDARTMRCTCQDGEFHSDVMNEDMACTENGATYAPTPVPTPYVAVIKPIVIIKTGPNATHILSSNSPVLEFHASGNYGDAQSTLYALFGILGLAVLLSLSVNVFLYTGVTDDVRKDRVLWTAALLPAVFHLLHCVPRKAVVEEVLAWDDAAEEKNFKKLVRQLNGEDEAYKAKKARLKKKRRRMKEAEAAADLAEHGGRANSSRDHAAGGAGGTGGRPVGRTVSGLGGEGYASPLIPKSLSKSMEESRLSKRKAARASGARGSTEATI